MTRSWMRALALLVPMVMVLGIPAAGGNHEDPDGPGACFDPPSGDVVDATGHAVVCVDITGVEPYDPEVLIVDQGTTVVWRNLDNIPHTVTFTAGSDLSFDSGVNNPGTHTWYTFTAPGTVYYDCRVAFPFHAAFMHGAVIAV